MQVLARVEMFEKHMQAFLARDDVRSALLEAEGHVSHVGPRTCAVSGVLTSEHP